MRVFVLCTGRNGSYAFMRACQHIENYTCGHESLSSKLGASRFAYSDNHIEVDNRLSWLLGRLDKRIGNDAFYVHMVRNREDTVASFNRRWESKVSIIKSYCQGILMTPVEKIRKERRAEICGDYYDTVNANIQFFLKDKSNKMTIRLTTVEDDFKSFWKKINAKGNLENALSEFNMQHNKSVNNSWDEMRYKTKLFILSKFKK